MEHALFIGLMSGTSVDAIDAALVNCRGDRLDLIATHQHELPQPVRERIAGISHTGHDEIERMGPLDRELGRLFAAAALALLDKSGNRPDQVRAIGSHGQTVRHRPPSAGSGPNSFTLQLGDPNTIAETTGISTVADFRRRDIAAGGEGAPLAPAFHAAAFAKTGVNRAIINIGGIANASLLRGLQLVMGFDTGPGNTLLDHWVQRHRSQNFDRDGQWSATGTVSGELLANLLKHPYFALSGPRSSGKEAFNLRWLDQCLQAHPGLAAEDVQATLAELTAVSIARAIKNCDVDITEVYTCGGGAHNGDLMSRLQRQLDPASLASTSAIGMDPDWVEAVTFAWLAHRTLEGLAGNAPAVTGASGPRVLGGIYPGG
jgi:anhydro-N-acetylmuramic acid kinase